MEGLQGMLQRLHDDTDNAEKWSAGELIAYTTFVAFIEGQHGIEFKLAGKGQESAYKLGREYYDHERVVEPHMGIGCGCPHCRLVRIMEDAIKEAEAVEYLLKRREKLDGWLGDIGKAAQEGIKEIEAGAREIRAMRPDNDAK